MDFLDREGALAARWDEAAAATLVEGYLERYRGQIKRKVDRYRRKLGKA